MSKYPVELSDGEGQVDAINYLLSGPAGLGQNFAGFSSDTDAYLTGFLRAPFTKTTSVSLAAGSASLFVSPGTNTTFQFGDRTLGYVTTPGNALSTLPIGTPLTITGITPTDWNSATLAANGYDIQPIGFVGYDVASNYNLVRTIAPIQGQLPTFVSGGTISWSGQNRYLGTDCEVLATVTGPTDRVFINGQLQLTLTFSGTGTGNTKIALVRYTLEPNTASTPPEFIYTNRTTLAEKTYASTLGTNIEAIFLSVVDSPNIGNYRYIIEVKFENVSGTRAVTNIQVNTRSISTQVVKE